MTTHTTSERWTDPNIDRSRKLDFHVICGDWLEMPLEATDFDEAIAEGADELPHGETGTVVGYYTDADPDDDHDNRAVVSVKVSRGCPDCGGPSTMKDGRCQSCWTRRDLD